MALYRILIKTHHMTSSKKILALTKATKRVSARVLIRTGGPPGIMLAEGQGALEWMGVVKRLRYKDFQLLKKEEVDRARIDVEEGTVMEVTSMKELGTFLKRDQVLWKWWRVWMGYQKDDDGS